MSRGIRVATSERLLGECIQKNNELQQENKELRQELDSANECSSVLYSEVERLKQENNVMLIATSKHLNKIDELRRANSNLNKRIESLSNTVRDLESKVAELEYD